LQNGNDHDVGEWVMTQDSSVQNEAAEPTNPDVSPRCRVLSRFGSCGGRIAAPHQPIGMVVSPVESVRFAI